MPNARKGILWAAMAAGCGGGHTTSAPPPPPAPPAVASVELSSPATVVEAGGNLQLAAIARDGSGATLSGRTFTWSTSASTVATVNDQGVVHGVGAGVVTITASTGGRSAVIVLTARDTTSLPAVLSGRIDRVNLTLAAGQTYRVTGDLVLFADSSLRILGNVEIDPGVKAIFFSTGTLDMAGDVGPAPTPALLRSGGVAAATIPTETVFGGQRVNFSGRTEPQGPIYIAGADTGPTNLSIVTIGPGATLQPDQAPSGTAAARDGTNGYDLEIGTGLARSKLGPLGQHSGPIRRLRLLQSLVTGGYAGNGYHLTRADGIVANNRWEGAGGRGGNGGRLALQADELELVGGVVHAGNAGAGGAADFLGGPLASGSGPNGEGESLFLQVGFGGDGGGFEITAALILGPAMVTRARKGGVLSPAISGGNGINGGSGGDLTVRMGLPGSDGAVTAPAGVTVASAETYVRPQVVVVNAVNGGNALTPSRAGGAGGIIKVEGPVPFSVPEVREITIVNTVARGGRGFNGCSLALFGNGTDGGPGGGLLSGGVTVTGGNDFHGGNGGDGFPNPGAGGPAGTHLGQAFGLVGLPGDPCPVLSVAPVSVIIDSNRPVGTCIDNNIPAGNIQITNLITAPTSYTVNVVNLQGVSGIGVIPGLAQTGPALPAVSGIAPASGQHVVWFDFDPCAARDGGGNAKAEFRVTAGNQTYIIPITVNMP